MNAEPDREPEAPPRLVDDLRRLHNRAVWVPPAVDERVLAAARAHARRLSRRAFGWQRLPPWLAAAAALAAVGFLVRLLILPADSPPTGAREDVNRDGQVDILDAFALARMIESGRPLEARWDMNGDRSVDDGDVAAIAGRAVRLSEVSAAPLQSKRTAGPHSGEHRPLACAVRRPAGGNAESAHSEEDRPFPSEARQRSRGQPAGRNGRSVRRPAERPLPSTARARSGRRVADRDGRVARAPHVSVTLFATEDRLPLQPKEFAGRQQPAIRSAKAVHGLWKSL